MHLLAFKIYDFDFDNLNEMLFPNNGILPSKFLLFYHHHFIMLYQCRLTPDIAVLLFDDLTQML